MPSLPQAIVRPLLAAAVVLAAVVAATQWTAALLAHHPALGAPWLDLLGLKLYAPRRVFSWWLAHGAQAPSVFARTGTLAALGGVMAGFIASGGAARWAGHGTPSPEHVLAVARTRSGKGFDLMVPALMTWLGSGVIHDIRIENWQLTAGWHLLFSNCLLLDPTSPLSDRLNPLREGAFLQAPAVSRLSLLSCHRQRR
jgi:type IV secretion system protein VirD4